LEFFGHIFGPRNATKLIKGSKDSYYSLESSKATKSAHWINWWCHQKQRKNYPNHNINNQKPQVQNLTFF